MATEMRTVAQAMEEAREALLAAGISTPRREADELYAALVQGPTSAVWRDRDERVPDGRLATLREAVVRRAAGWPQAYATGWAAFRGHWLEVDRRVLIPRPETEGLVELVMEWVRARGQADRPTGGQAEGRSGAGGMVADVGTGSGAIAIALALEGPFDQVWAIDRSAGALAVAQQNARRLGVEGRVTVVPGDLLEPLEGRQVDVVVSNPPYIATAELTELDASVRDFEPVLALDGGADGLEPTRRLAAAARRALAPGGLLALEVDSRRATESAVALEAAGFSAVAIAYDFFQRPRYVWAEHSGV
ncbi:MAG: peptide chain release factor N(5)-glutamine methyltransferase [Gemmatimonadota bacterium]